MLITFDNVSFSYGENLIFKNVSFSLNEGCRTALIGANGEGKTTLLKLLTGRLHADSGGITIKNGIKIGYLEQNGGYQSGNTVYDEMLGIFKTEIESVEKLSSLSAELSVAEEGSKEYSRLAAKLEALNKYISSHDCFNTEVKIKTVLNGMGFSKMYERVIDTMSGGEKTRLLLCKLLLEECDLLVLDEPTNHLDMETLFWLEDYLKSFKGGIFVVSHDRYFLDKLVNNVLELENKGLNSFAGNYTKYKVLKAELVARLLKEFEAEEEKREKLQDYIAKNSARASTAKSAQSRVKQLEKLPNAEKPFVPPRPPRFIFEYDNPPYADVLTIENYSLTRGGKMLVKDLSLSVKRGDKLALIGKNGTGKSSLLKDIVNGERGIKIGRGVKLSYYDQENKNLDGENTVLYELWGRHTGLGQTEVRAALARCGLFQEDMEKPVKSLSGGERAKLSLCVLESERGNVLLLDEPTNHLDLPAQEALEYALKAFDGTLIFVSHDRYFISALADSIAEIDDGALKKYAGGFESFIDEQNREKGEEPVAEKRDLKGASAYRSKAQRAEDERRKARIKEIEKSISEFEKEEEEINVLLSNPEVTADYVKVNELIKKTEGIKLQLDELYKEYETML